MQIAPMDSNVDEADLWFSRVNIAQARSQRLLQSWLPKGAVASSSTPAEADDEDDFVGLTESAGLGTKPKDIDFEVDGVLKRRHASSNDKLLEQLLGKKAAAAKKKEHALAKQSKSNIALRRPALGSMNGTTTTGKTGAAGSAEPSTGSGEDDEPGRAATFTSRKVKLDRHRSNDDTVLTHGQDITPAEDPEPAVLQEDPASDTSLMTKRVEDVEENAKDRKSSSRPAKKKATSYLDELLSEKKKKKLKS